MTVTFPFRLDYTVTAEHIASGQICNAYACPIALAIKDALNQHHPGHGLTVLVDGETIDLYHKNRRFARTRKGADSDTPPIGPFVTTFDCTQNGQPFSSYAIFHDRHPAD